MYKTTLKLLTWRILATSGFSNIIEAYMAYDIIIKNAVIIDGTGREEFSGSLAITGKKIAAISNEEISGPARRVIDAKGSVVCPGFIDITNHSDTTGTLFSLPSQESLLRQGITTIIGGNCGSSLAPLLYSNAIASLQKWQTGQPIPVDWLSVGEFLEFLEKFRPSVNVGTLVGFGMLKRGITKNKNQLLSFEDFLKLKYVLGEALKEGAFGLSTGLVYAHERSTTTADLIDIGSVLKKEGGIYKTHLRSEAGDLLGAVNEALTIGREAQIPVSISHFKAIGKKTWRQFNSALTIIEHAAEDGVSVLFDMYPYSTTGSFLYLLLPSGAYEGGFSGLFARLKDSKLRLKIIQMLEKKTLHYESIVVSTAWKTKNSVGKSIKEISEHIGVSPEETLVQLLMANEGRITIFGRTVRKNFVRRALEHPLSCVASDGSGYTIEYRKSQELVHPRSFGAFPRFIRLATKRWNSLTLPQAVQKATSIPALFMGIKHRGILAEKNYADIIIFDRERIQSAATFRNPYQYAYGISWVIINGSVVIREGKYQKVRSGMALKRNS